MVECVVRRLPSVSPSLGQLSQRVENNEKATLVESSFRSVEVAGTRNIVYTTFDAFPVAER